jgi:hypothetical protein
MVVSLLRASLPDLVSFRNKLATSALKVGYMHPEEGATTLSRDLVLNSALQSVHRVSPALPQVGPRAWCLLGC